jgi:hypothetical protein
VALDMMLTPLLAHLAVSCTRKVRFACCRHSGDGAYIFQQSA